MLRSKAVTVALLILLAVAVLSIGLSRAETGERQALRQVLGSGPGRFHYQGLLLDAQGNPYPDGDYRLVFSLYELPTATVAFWSEVWTASVQNGLFSVTLGLQNPLPVFQAGRRLWLGIALADQGELSPRHPLISIPASGEGGRPFLLYLGHLGLPLGNDGRWYGEPFP